MTRPNLPLSGGTYIEHADGRLERIGGQAPTPSRDAGDEDDASTAVPGSQPKPRPPFSGRAARAQPAASGTDPTPTTTAHPATTE